MQAPRPSSPVPSVAVLAIVVAVAVATGCSPDGEEAPAAAGDAGTGIEATTPAADPTADAFAIAFAGPIEEAQGARAWAAAEAVSADVTVTFGGRQALDGRMLFTPEVGRSRLELADGTVAVFDGERAWVSPASAELPRARFHLLTWPYFLAAPFKLRDPGTHLEDLGTRPLGGEPHPAARLTFEPGVGDSPNDWYVVYRDPDTDRLAALAYIVTYGGRSAGDAGTEPHAVTYHDFHEVGSVILPTTWRFWPWSEEQGVHGDPLGEVTLSDLRFVAPPRFVTPPSDAFDRPADAREDPLPAAE
jgi:hypothetical protein